MVVVDMRLLCRTAHLAMATIQGDQFVSSNAVQIRLLVARHANLGVLHRATAVRRGASPLVATMPMTQRLVLSEVRSASLLVMAAAFALLGLAQRLSITKLYDTLHP